MKITVFTTYLTRYEGEMSQIRLNVIQKLQNRWVSNKFFIKKSIKSSEMLKKREWILGKSQYFRAFFVFQFIAENRSTVFVSISVCTLYKNKIV